MRNAECGMRNADWGLRIADCGLRIGDCGLRIGDCRKDELGMQELKGGILATDGSYGRSPSGMNTESGGGRRWGSAGASPYRSCGRSIIRRGEFHESPFLPIRVPSVANNLLMVIRLRNAEAQTWRQTAETHKLRMAVS